jgi:hypothetical protein
MNHKFISLLLAFWFTGTAAPSLADQIYTYLDENGKRVFTNVGPSASHPFAGDSSIIISPSKLKRKQTNSRSGELAFSKELRSKIASLAEKYDLAKFNVGPEFVEAVIQVESNYSPSAVSRKGALGLMQLMPGTAKRFGVRNSFDPAQNLEGGIQYLKFLLETFSGDVNLTLAAYNAGENVVQKLRAVPPYRETRDYVRRVSEILGYSKSIPLFDLSKKQLTYVSWVDGKLQFTNVDPPTSAIVFDGYHLPKASGTP